MALSEQQLALIRTSFKTLRDDPQPRSIEFYEALFRHAPNLRGMFREDLAGQGMRFMSTLSAIVDNLHSPGAMAERYADLGVGHRALGVTAADFAPMGQALMDTLAAQLGARFTEDTRAAWETAYAAFSQEIIDRGGIPES